MYPTCFKPDTVNKTVTSVEGREREGGREGGREREKEERELDHRHFETLLYTCAPHFCLSLFSTHPIPTKAHCFQQYGTCGSHKSLRRRPAARQNEVGELFDAYLETSV